jgi:hypothetical protein
MSAAGVPTIESMLEVSSFSLLQHLFVSYPGILAPRQRLNLATV